MTPIIIIGLFASQILAQSQYSWTPEVEWTQTHSLVSKNNSSSRESLGLTKAKIFFDYHGNQDGLANIHAKLNLLSQTRYDNRAGSVYRRKKDNRLLEQVVLEYKPSQHTTLSVGILESIFHQPQLEHPIQASLEVEPPSHMQVLSVFVQPSPSLFIGLLSFAGDDDRVEVEEHGQQNIPRAKDPHTGVGLSLGYDKSLIKGRFTYGTMREKHSDRNAQNERHFLQTFCGINNLNFDFRYEREKFHHLAGEWGERRSHYSLTLRYGHEFTPSQKLIGGLFHGFSQFSLTEHYRNHGADILWKLDVNPQLSVALGGQFEARKSLLEPANKPFDGKSNVERLVLQLSYR